MTRALQGLYLITVVAVVFWLVYIGGTEPRGQTSRLRNPLRALSEWAAEDWDGPMDKFAEAACQLSLDRISQALRQYHDEYGRFPPAVVRGPNGQPLYSWRVLILPQLGYRSLYDQFALDEPWDSEHNITLVPLAPSVYRCEKDVDAKIGSFTSYLLLTGTNTAYAIGNRLPWDQLERAVGNQVLLVERSDSGIVWSQPGDVDVHDLEATVGSSPECGIRSHHEGAAVVAPVLGDSEVWHRDMSEESIRRRLVFRGD